MTRVPENPKIYHILPLDALASVVADRYLWCDAAMAKRPRTGSLIGLSGIKKRRLYELKLASHPHLFVGDCVPFYFCPRSIMLYVIHKGNHPELTYHSGQEPIVHLEADLLSAVAWADSEKLKWAFTLSNAGAYYFEDRCDLRQLAEVDWTAVESTNWSGCKEGKQAEFLVEGRFPWHLVERIGVHSRSQYGNVARLLGGAPPGPRVEVLPSWYY